MRKSTLVLMSGISVAWALVGIFCLFVGQTQVGLGVLGLLLVAILLAAAFVLSEMVPLLKRGKRVIRLILAPVIIAGVLYGAWWTWLSRGAEVETIERIYRLQIEKLVAFANLHGFGATEYAETKAVLSVPGIIEAKVGNVAWTMQELGLCSKGSFIPQREPYVGRPVTNRTTITLREGTKIHATEYERVIPADQRETTKITILFDRDRIPPGG